MISNYGELRVAVADFLNRTDLTQTQIENAVVLAEGRLRRDVRSLDKLKTIIEADAEEITLPTDVEEAVSISRLSNTWPGPVRVKTPEEVASLRLYLPVSGVPEYAFIINNKMTFAPAPDQAYELELVYFPSLTTITGGDASTNWVLSKYPGLYLFATLEEMQAFLKEDERITTWATKYTQAIDALTLQRDRAEHPNTAVLRPRPLGG